MTVALARRSCPLSWMRVDYIPSRNDLSRFHADLLRYLKRVVDFVLLTAYTKTVAHAGL